MIPLLTTETGSAQTQAAGQQAVTAAREGEDSFADLMADLGAAEDGEAKAAPAPVEVEGEAAVALPTADAPADQRSAGAPDTAAKPDVTLRKPSDAGTVPATPAASTTKVGPKPELQPQTARTAGPDPAPQSGERAEAAPTTAERPRASTVQSVLEGRMPNARQPEASDVKDAPRLRAPETKAVQSSPDAPSANQAATGARSPVSATAVPADALTAEPDRKAVRDDPQAKTQTTVQAKATPLHTQAAQPPAVALAQTATQPLREMAEKTSRHVDADVLVTVGSVERLAQGPSVQASTPAATANPEVARHAAAQIAIAITNTPGKATEIALNPEELGRVRLSLMAGDGTITLNILAERPETQDLLRRHMDLLAQEFRQLGYSSISFTFGEQKGQDSYDNADPAFTQDSEPEDAPAQPTLLTDPSGAGLDLRI